MSVNAGHEHVSETRGSGIVSSAADGLEMLVVRVMREVSEVCERSGFWLCQSCGNMGIMDVCLCLGCGGMGEVGGESVGCLG